MDTLCGSHAPVTSVVLYKSFVVSASTAAASIHMWNLKYDTQHKPTAHIPSGCAHVAITKDEDRVFYVQHPSQTEVISWNNHTGQCQCREESLQVSEGLTAIFNCLLLILEVEVVLLYVCWAILNQYIAYTTMNFM